MNYVYSHIRKDNEKCFYIGKGTGNRAWSTYSRNRHWSFVANKGYDVSILVNNVSEEKALEIEKSFIEQIGLENLTNYKEGGTGGFTKEARKKASSKESREKAYLSTDWSIYKGIKVVDRYKDYQFKNGHRSKPVQGTNMTTGETFAARNMTEAAKMVDGTLGGVSDVICGGRKSHRNHTFKKI